MKGYKSHDHLQILHLFILSILFIEIGYWCKPTDEEELDSQIKLSGFKYIFPSDVSICILICIVISGLVANMCLMAGTFEKHPLIVSLWLVLQSVFIIVEVTTSILISVIFATKLKSMFIGLLIFFSSLFGTAVHFYMVAMIYNVFQKERTELYWSLSEEHFNPTVFNNINVNGMKSLKHETLFSTAKHYSEMLPTLNHMSRKIIEVKFEV